MVTLNKIYTKAGDGGKTRLGDNSEVETGTPGTDTDDSNSSTDTSSNTGTDTNPSGANAYPISTLTWVLAYATENGDNTPALKKTFAYMLSNKAQSQAPSLGYVPLPSSIRRKSLAAVQQIQ